MRFFKTSALFWGGIAAVSILTAVVFLSGNAQAMVRGACVNCHTMHNSQGGAGMVSVRGDEFDAAGTGECNGCHMEPRDHLLKFSCVSCHALDLTPGPALPEFDGYDVPQVVYSVGAGTNNLAAGNFYYVFDGVGGDEYGHNVHGFNGIGGPGGNITDEWAGTYPLFAPPGYNTNMDYGSPKFYPTPEPKQVMCAGAYGCHGNRQVESQTAAVAGAHHANDSVMKASGSLASQGTTVGTSYRFLSGVQGLEHGAWEYGATNADHNEYIGADIGSRTSTTQAATDINTMSEFCAGCHGRFHMTGSSGLGNPSPWIRHPSDVLMPSGSAPYNLYVSYDVDTPIARVAFGGGPYPTDASEVGSNNAIVFCLSCHRAHASNELDSLRFSYSLMETGTTGSGASTGCFACHGDKDGV